MAFVALYAYYGFLAPEAGGLNSQDMNLLYATHVAESQTKAISPLYHNFGEFTLLLANLASPITVPTKEAYFRIFLFIQLTLLSILTLTQRDKAERLVTLVLVLMLSSVFNYVHIFRQYCASLLVLLAFRKRGLLKAILIVAAIGLHNFGSLFAIFLMVLLQNKASMAKKIALMTIVAVTVFAVYEILESLLKARYGFAFLRKDEDEFIVNLYNLYKYFAVAIVVAFFTLDRRLWLLSLMPLFIMVPGIFLGINSEALFRVVAPFRYIFIPILGCGSLSRIVGQFAVDRGERGGRRGPSPMLGAPRDSES
jgi:hypothetical protein